MLDGLRRQLMYSRYGMNFIFTHPDRRGRDICLQHEQGAPGPCLGGTKAQCPGVFLGMETEGGTPVSCQGDNVGVSTFVSFSQIVLGLQAPSSCETRSSLSK